MPNDTLTDAELARIQYTLDEVDLETESPWAASLLLDMAALYAALRQARGLVAALAYHVCDQGEYYRCPECGVSYGLGGLEPDHALDCDWDRARAALAAWAGEEVK